MKDIRPFVTFDYNLRKPLSEAAKRKIAKYHSQIEKLNVPGREFYKVNVRHAGERAGKIKSLQRVGQEEYLPELKGAFIPKGEGPVEVKWRGNRPIIETEYIRHQFFPFNPRKLAKDADKEINAAILDDTAKQYTIAAGDNEIPHTMIRSSVNKHVKELMAKYDGVTVLPGRTKQRAKNQNWRNWLSGVHAYNFTSQGDYKEYQRERQSFKEKTKRDRAAARKRARDRGRKR